jgi:hypothetical protein
MSECQRKVNPASAFLPVVSCLSPASAFRHQGSVWYRWSRISPALPSYGIQDESLPKLFFPAAQMQTQQENHIFTHYFRNPRTKNVSLFIVILTNLNFWSCPKNIAIITGKLA